MKFHSIVGVLFTLFASLKIFEATKVPVILWNIKGSSLQLQPVSAFEANSREVFNKIIKNALKDENTGVVAFLLDKLSLEDFSVESADASNSTIKILENFLETQRYMLLPSVKNPKKQLANLPCKIANIDVISGENVNNDVSSALNDACVATVRLPESYNISQSYSLLTEEIFRPSFKSSKKNIIGVFTGEKSSWDFTKSNHKTRSLLAFEEVDENFINFNNCIIMYVENVTLQIGDTGNDTRYLPLPPSVDGTCGNSSMLELKFGQSGDVSEVVLKFEFDEKRSQWSLANSTATVTGNKAPEEEVHLKSPLLEAPVGFSFSCGSFTLRSINASVSVTISMDGFQIQPYQVGNNSFAESFDCVPFFTLPIWMGVFVAVLFIIIMNTGIYALFAIKTMDRFDDPKGKTISVPLSMD